MGAPTDLGQTGKYFDCQLWGNEANQLQLEGSQFIMGLLKIQRCSYGIEKKQVNNVIIKSKSSDKNIRR